MSTQLAVGDWAYLTVLDADAQMPSGLAEVAFMWQADPRRFPVLLTLRREPSDPHPYVAVLPDDAPPFDADAAHNVSLDGLLLAEPREHVCFACGEAVAVLYADFGLPTPGDWRGRHTTVSQCPACGADGGSSRLTGLAMYRR